MATKKVLYGAVAIILFAAAILLLAYFPPLAEQPGSEAPETGGTEAVGEAGGEQPAKETPEINETQINETNETVAAPAEMLSEKPDIVLLGITYSPLFPRITEPITFTAEVRNAGKGDADLGVYKLVPLVDSATVISRETAGKQILGAGESTTITAVWKIPSGGLWTVESRVDVYKNLEEHNETNNQVRIKLRVQPSTGFVGCKDGKFAVCDSVLQADPEYFAKYINCTAVPSCTEPLALCDPLCPHPGGER